MRESKQNNDGLLQTTIGDNHSLAVNNSGKVYGWGFTDKSQLGKYDLKGVGAPIELHKKMKLTNSNFVCAGSMHNMAYNKKDNRLIVWGDNSRAQLGLGHFKDMGGIISLETVVKKSKLVHCEVRCDMNAIVKEDGTAVVWPFQHFHNTNFDPLSIKLPSSQKIINVSLGFEFVMILSSHGQ